MGLQEYRVSPSEIERTRDLLRMAPSKGTAALDVGARDGHFSILLSDRYDQVIALDLAKPAIDAPRVTCVEGDATNLKFSTGAFDLVFCAEVLEHIPTERLESACRELERVSGRYILIGVPYRQDTRVGRTTCYTCFGISPPWGHLNEFDEKKLLRLFKGSSVVATSYVGKTNARTNWLSTWLMDRAGNPYGTYSQDEACTRCGQSLVSPPKPGISQRILSRIAFSCRELTQRSGRGRPKWIHVLYEKNNTNEISE
jgi:hypothetical protein